MEKIRKDYNHIAPFGPTYSRAVRPELPHRLEQRGGLLDRCPLVRRGRHQRVL